MKMRQITYQELSSSFPHIIDDLIEGGTALFSNDIRHPAYFSKYSKEELAAVLSDEAYLCARDMMEILKNWRN